MTIEPIQNPKSRIQNQDNPFLDCALPAAPRLLSLLNRNTVSPLAGSFDRSFWHYRTVTDYPGPTWQAGALSLARLYSDPIFGPSWHGKPALKELALSSMRHWASLQHEDGSFDEWYPNEFSHVATAFTTYAVSEAYLLLGLDDQIVKGAITRAGVWLSHNFDRQVLNHTAGAVAALANIHKMTGLERFRLGLEENIEVMEAYQSPEGWFMENGSFDVAYQSVSIDYLVKAWERSGHESLRRLIDRAVEFLDWFVYPDGTSGGPIGNRNTRYLFPAGLLRYAPHSLPARRILRRFLGALQAGNVVTPLAADDRYFTFFFLPNYLEAAVEYEKVRSFFESPPPEDEANPLPVTSRHFKDAGVIVRRHGETSLWLNYRKGGVFRYFRGARLARVDSGWFARLRDGRVVTSCLLANREDVTVTEKKITIATFLKEVDFGVPFRKFFLPFRAFNYTLGASPALGARAAEIIKNYFVRGRKESEFGFVREIEFNEDGTVDILDDLSSLKGAADELVRETAGTGMHVPTSRYFVPEDLDFQPLTIEPGRISTVLKPDGD